jgi:hypothetical protein
VARQPAVRVNNARDYLDFFERDNPALYRHLLTTLPPVVIAGMRSNVRTDWIPVEQDGQYVDAVLAFLGPDGTKAASRKFLVESLVKSPMMRGMFDGAVRIFGVSVGGFLRLLPHALAQSYRDSFTISLERGDKQGLLVFDDIAPELLRFSAYPVIWEGIFLGLYDLAHAKPQLDFALDRVERRMRARFHW